jgi:hypothetical protein
LDVGYTKKLTACVAGVRNQGGCAKISDDQKFTREMPFDVDMREVKTHARQDQPDGVGQAQSPRQHRDQC